MEKAELRFKVLGTDVYLVIACEKDEKDLAQNSLEEAKEIYLAQNKIFSRFDPKSELSHSNGNLGKFIKVSEDFLTVVKKVLQYYRESQGIFDSRIIEALERIGYKKNFKDNDFKDVEIVQGDKFVNLEEDLKIEEKKVFFGKRMDFSGIVKGFITDKVAEFLKKNDWKNFLVDSGGDISVSGKNAEDKEWIISLEEIPEDKLLLGVSNEGLATSGITRRKWSSDGRKFHHLINPKNITEFKFDLKSVTVIAEDTAKSDVWAKVLFLLGKEAGLKLSEENNIKSLFLDYKGALFLSSRVRDNIIK